MFPLIEKIFFSKNTVTNLPFSETKGFSIKFWLKSLFFNSKFEQIVAKCRENALIIMSLRIINYVIISSVILSIYNHVCSVLINRKSEDKNKKENFLKRKLKSAYKYLSFTMISSDESNHFEFATLSAFSYILKSIISLIVIAVVRRNWMPVDVTSLPVFLGSTFLGALIMDVLIRNYSSLKKRIGKKIAIIHTINFEEESPTILTEKEKLNQNQENSKQIQELNLYALSNGINFQKLKEFGFFVQEKRINLEEAEKFVSYALENHINLRKIQQFSEILLKAIPEIYNLSASNESFTSSKLHEYVFSLLERSIAQDTSEGLPKKDVIERIGSIAGPEDKVDVEMNRKIALYASEKGLESSKIIYFTEFIFKHKINYVKMEKLLSHMSEKEIKLDEFKVFADFKFTDKKKSDNFVPRKTSIEELQKSKSYHFAPIGITLVSLVAVRVLSESRSIISSFLNR